MARATTRIGKGKGRAKAARARKVTKAPARKAAQGRKAPAATVARAAAPGPKVAELQAEIRRLREEIAALRARPAEVPAIAFGAPTDEQPTA